MARSSRHRPETGRKIATAALKKAQKMTVTVAHSNGPTTAIIRRRSMRVTAVVATKLPTSSIKRKTLLVKKTKKIMARKVAVKKNKTTRIQAAKVVKGPETKTAKSRKRSKNAVEDDDKNDENDEDDEEEPKKRTKKAAKKPAGKKHPNEKLTPRPDLPDLLVEPTFSRSTPPKFVSAKTAGRLALRAVLNNDIAELRRVVNDHERFPAAGLQQCRSFALNHNVEIYAILSEDRKLIDAVINEKERMGKETDGKRVAEEPNLLNREGTGRANFRMLGHATRAIQMTRGGREGNNALIMYEEADEPDTVATVLQHDVNFGIIEHLVGSAKPHSNFSRDCIAMNIYHAVRFGNRKLAARLIETYSSYNFNDLHIQTLKNDNQPLKKFVSVSVLKKGRENRNITPVHTACINPNANYLKELMAAEPSYNTPDTDNWYPIHYAAVCEGPAPLKLLLERGTMYTIANKLKDTPLHCAARAGRAANVELLLKAFSKDANASKTKTGDDEEEEEDEAVRAKKQKPVPSPINARNNEGYTALHLAAKFNRLDVVDHLLHDAKIDVETQTTAPKQKLTALMVACQFGHRDIVEKLIITGKAIIEKRDKLKRTALTHAIINGNSHCAAYLLRAGASPLSSDSSGNTPLHYAIAYGWYHCVELLLKASKEPLAMNNDWHLSPFAVAYLKGHVGIVDQLLEGPYADQVDVNCTDNEGVSLVSSLIKFYEVIDSPTILHQLQYLVGKKVDCSKTDTAGNTPLHYFAAVNAQLQVGSKASKKSAGVTQARQITVDEYKKCVELIVKAGADPRTKNEEGKDAIAIALSQGNLLLVELLLDKYGSVHDLLEMTDMANKRNILHQLVQLPFIVYGNNKYWMTEVGPESSQYNVIPLVEKIIGADKEMVRQWLHEIDKFGMTPTLLACSEYCRMQLGRSRNGLEDTIQAKREAEKLLNTVGAVIKLFVGVESKCILQQTVRPGEDGLDAKPVVPDNSIPSIHNGWRRKKQRDAKRDDDNEPATQIGGAKISCLQYALRGNPIVASRAKSWTMNGIEYTTSKKLLVNIIGMAKNDAFLAELLMLEDEKEETGLLYALKQCLATEAMLIVHESSEAGCASIVHSAMIKHVVDEQKKEKPYMKSVLMLAIENCMLNVVHALELSIDQWNAVDAQGNNAMHYAAKQANNAGRTPLHVAVNASASSGADVLVEPVEWLIANGGPEMSGLLKQDEDGRLPLHYAFVKYDKRIDEQSTKAIEPIAVVSVLIQAIRKDKLDISDKYGNTALHLAAQHGANICVITLMRNGCDPHRHTKIGNSPLALAALNHHEPATLTLIQANSDIQSDAFVEPAEEKQKDKNEKWTWVPRRKEHLNPRPQSIVSIIVRNEWQGIIFIILDMLSKTADTVGKLLAAAVQYRKYNLAVALLRPLRGVLNANESRRENLEALNRYRIFETFCCNFTGNLNEHIRKLVDEFFEIGIKWYEEVDRKAGSICSPALIQAAKGGKFELLDLIQELDAKYSNGRNWQHLTATPEANPIAAIVEFWLCKNGEKSPLIEKWIKSLAAKLDVNQAMLFDRPYYAGIVDGLPQRPIAQQYRAPPLIHAIQHRNVDLVRVLLGLPTIDVNARDEDGLNALMHAVQVNSTPIVRLLLDPSCKFNNETMPQEELSPEAVPNQGLFNGSAMFASSLVNIRRKATKPTVDRIKARGRTPNLFKFSNTRLNYEQTDNQGANFVHHMISPCAWENTALLNDLSEVLPDMSRLLSQRDAHRKETPGDWAAALGQTAMAAAIAAITKVSKQPTYATVPIVPPAKYDVNADSTKFLEAEKSKKSAVIVAHRPHKNSGYESTGELVVCNETGQEMNILLNKTDVQYGTYGFHNYYRMQLIRRKGSDLYVLFTNWGRIGDGVGQYQRTPFSNLADGIKEFMSVYKSKTGNEWGRFEEFVERPGRYRLIRVETDSISNIGDLSLNFDVFEKNETEQEQHDVVYQFIKDVSNVRRLQEKTRAVCRYAQPTQPFGRLNRDDIIKAKDVLDQLRIMIPKIDDARKANNTGGDVDAILSLLRKQADLSNQFYKFLPLGGFEDQVLPVIDSSAVINEFDSVIENLLEFEIAGRLVTAAAFRQTQINPFRYIEATLECDIRPVDEGLLTTQYILQYINASERLPEITGIFEVNARAMNEAFDKNGRLKNHMYLWHGTKPENMLSILKLGLLVTPPSAIQTGQIHGKGIYFADSFGKSQAYCTSSSNGTKYMLLCQVALGEQKCGINQYEAEPKDTGSMSTTVDSLLIIGQNRPDPNYNLTLTTGAVMPIGPTVTTKPTDFGLSPDTNACMPFNEYIVYKPSQATVRYIVAFK